MNVFIFFALPALFFILTGFVSQVSAQGCGFSLISSDENRIVLRFELPPWKLEPVEAAGADFSQIRTRCGEDLLASGYPIVPQYKALVAVPPGSQASLRWSGENSLELHAGRLLPAQPASENRGDEDSRACLVQ